MMPVDWHEAVMMASTTVLKRGFLPESDPCTHFYPGSSCEYLDQLGRDLPSILLNSDAREYLRAQLIPHWQSPPGHDLAQLRLYYLRLGFIASGYINQVGAPACRVLPKNIAVPLCHACSMLQRPPMLSYDGYALYNWKRFDNNKPICLGNIDTLQNFVHLYDEHWFILVHVEIEALAAKQLAAILAIVAEPGDGDVINQQLQNINRVLQQQLAVLKRIPEKMSPALYFKTFRPYIRCFEQVSYEGVNQPVVNQRGETGAQSSIMPSLVALLKIPHRSTALTDHLRDMRRYMPAEHRQFIAMLETVPAIKARAQAEVFNALLETIAQFREVHYQWAKQYIHERTDDPRGTGGTPYMQWLQQLITETRNYMVP